MTGLKKYNQQDIKKYKIKMLVLIIGLKNAEMWKNEEDRELS